MIETAKTLLGLIKDWKTSSDPVYQWVACGAGILTVSAYIEQQRPSEFMAGTMRFIGAGPAAVWFESGLPPVVAQPNVGASHIVLGVAGLAVLTMLVRPFINARRDEWPVDLQAAGLLGARGACTVWILLLIAAQLGSLDRVPIWLWSVLPDGIMVIAIAILVTGLFYLITRRFWTRSSSEAFGRRLSWLVAGAAVVVAMTLCALLLAVIGPLVSLVSWLFSTESDAHNDTKTYVAEIRAQCESPTGVAPATGAPDGRAYRHQLATLRR